MTSKTIVITKPANLLNQEFARTIECANSFESHLSLSTGDVSTNAKSPFGVLALQMHAGMSLEIIADGPDEIQAMDALSSHLCG